MDQQTHSQLQQRTAPVQIGGRSDWEMKDEWATQDSTEPEIYNPVATVAPLILPKGIFTDNCDACMNSAEQKLCGLGDDSDLW